ncbi:hypothetical protein EI94DRAFT_1814781 [Lactarius quietus]|nr:hypothetical protein EI94DRAFT_1814781 [Lactarius quietus]
MLALEKERSVQLTPLQVGTSGLSGVGSLAPVAEATGSGFDTMDQVMADLYRTPPPPNHRPSGLPCCKTRLPAHYRDVLPPPAPAVTQPISSELQGPLSRDTHSSTTLLTFTSLTNSFGIYQVYNSGVPSYMPDDADFMQSSTPHTAPSFIPSNISPVHESLDSSANPLSLYHFENPSIFRLMLWYHYGAITKSLNDLNVLVQNVICAPDFQVEHFKNFDAMKALDKLFEQGESSTSDMPLRDGWHESSVPISLTCNEIPHKFKANAPTLNVPGLYHCRPLDVIKAALQESNA